ncbi:MAG: hypothetical protein R2865_10505 [Deinococcales bacterium]
MLTLSRSLLFRSLTFLGFLAMLAVSLAQYANSSGNSRIGYVGSCYICSPTMTTGYNANTGYNYPTNSVNYPGPYATSYSSYNAASSYNNASQTTPYATYPVDLMPSRLSASPTPVNLSYTPYSSTSSAGYSTSYSNQAATTGFELSQGNSVHLGSGVYGTLLEVGQGGCSYGVSCASAYTYARVQLSYQGAYNTVYIYNSPSQPQSFQVGGATITFSGFSLANSGMRSGTDVIQDLSCYVR